MKFKGAHFLSVDQIDSITDLKILFSLAEKLEIISTRKKITRVLEGAVLANLFFEPSTRTRISFGSAFNLLGGSVQETSDIAASSIVKGESIIDTSKIISGYADIMVVRHSEAGAVADFAQASTIPVINAGDGVGEHPTQALLDVYTMFKELGQQSFENLSADSLSDLTICMVGDLKHGRTVHSLSKLLSLFHNIQFILVSPPALKMPATILKLLCDRGHRILETENLAEALETAQVVYMTRIQQERFKLQEEFIECAELYSIDADFYKKYCKQHPVLMHPLPRNSRLKKPEIDNDLNTHPKLAIFRQAANGLTIRMALFGLILGVEKNLTDFSINEKVKWCYQ